MSKKTKLTTPTAEEMQWALMHLIRDAIDSEDTFCPLSCFDGCCCGSNCFIERMLLLPKICIDCGKPDHDEDEL
jgi:hypothetical protein